MKRIGMLTSGGDCQSLNATMRGVVKGLNVLRYSDNRWYNPRYIQTAF